MSDTWPRVLVIDDDKLQLALLADLLQERFTVVTAPDGTRGLTLLAGEPFAAVLSDHVMPGPTGVEVLERCLTLQPDAARLLVTASESAQDIRDAVNVARVHRVVPKPVQAIGFDSIVAGAIREAGLERENARLVDELRSALAELQGREEELERELRIRTEELQEILTRFGRLGG